MATLKEFNGKQPCIGNVYMIMRALHHNVAALRNAPFNKPRDLVEYLEDAPKNREALVASNLHYVVKEVPHLWWFTSSSVGKMLPHIAQRILAQVVSSSLCQ